MKLSKTPERLSNQPNNLGKPDTSYRLSGYLIAVIALLVVLAAASVYFYQKSQQQAELSLKSEVQHLLEQANQEESADERSFLARKALRLLQEQRVISSDQEASFALLHATALVMNHEDQAAQKMLESANLEDCSMKNIETAARAFFHTAHFQQADRLVGQLLATDRPSESGLRTAALVRYELGRDKEVLNYCDQLIKLAPQDERAWLVKAKVYTDQGYTTQVKECLEQAAELKPDDKLIRFQYVKALIDAGDAELARKNFDSLGFSVTGQVDGITMVEAQIRYLEGRIHEAQTLIETFLESYPQDTEALLLKGKIELSQQEYDAARLTFTSLLKLDPASHQAHYSLGQVYARLQDNEQARRHFDLHKTLLEKKTYLHRLEQQAGREPDNRAVRLELAEEYRKLGFDNLANYWTRSASVIP